MKRSRSGSDGRDSLKGGGDGISGGGGLTLAWDGNTGFVKDVTGEGISSQQKNDKVVVDPSSEPLAENLAENLSDLLRNILQRTDEFEADRMRGVSERVALSEQVGSEDEDKDKDGGYGERLTSAVDTDELLGACERVAFLGGKGFLGLVDQDVLVEFVKVLDQALVSAGRSSNKKKEQWRRSLQQLELAEAALGIMCLAGIGGDVDPRVVSGEVLDNVVQACKRQMHGTLFPFIDTEFNAKLNGTLSTNTAKDKDKGKDMQKNKTRFHKAAHSGCEDKDEDEQKTKSDDVVKLTANMAASLTTSLCRVLLALDQTVASIPKLEDELLLQVAGLCVSALVVEPKRGFAAATLGTYVTQVQQASIDLLRSLFRNQKDHRDFIFDEIVESIPKLPKAQKNLRTYNVGSNHRNNGSGGGGDGVEEEESIQTTVALVLELVQSSCLSPSSLNQEHTQVIPAFDTIQNLSLLFLQKLLDKCSTPAEHADDEDTKQYCVFLGHLVEDLLAVLDRPEWPAAELLLKMLSGFIANHLLKQNQPDISAGEAKTKKNSEAQAAAAQRNRFSIQALFLLGTLLARIQSELEYTQHNQLVLPAEHRRKSPEEDKATCPVCGISTLPGCNMEVEEDMIGVRKISTSFPSNSTTACIDCGFLFHDKCLCAGVEQDKSFCCDDCLMLSQLEHSATPYAYDLYVGIGNVRPGDTAAFRQLLLNYLSSTAASGSTSARFAYEYNLSMWAANDAKCGGDSSDNGRSGSNNMNDVGAVPNSDKVLQMQWLSRTAACSSKNNALAITIADNNNTGGSRGSTPALAHVRRRLKISRGAALAIIKQLGANSAFGFSSRAASTNMLTRLLVILGVGAPQFRARAIKALGVVVEANPALMTHPRVKEAVRLRVLDEAISVREAALELVGKYVLARPELVRDYQNMLVQRLSDLGVSVRKRVVKIFHKLLMTHNEGYDRTAVHAALALRIEDANEESVRENAIAIFRDLWFSESSRHAQQQLGVCNTNIFKPSGGCGDRFDISTENGFEPKRGTVFRTPMQAVYAGPSFKIDHQMNMNGLSFQTELENMPNSDKCASAVAAALTATTTTTAGSGDQPLARHPSSLSFVSSCSAPKVECVRNPKENAADIMNLVGVDGDHEWLTTLLKTILGTNISPFEDNEKSPLVHRKRCINSSSSLNLSGDLKSTAATMEESRRVCIALTEHLVSRLLELQDEDTALVVRTADGRTIHTNIEEETFKVMRTLGLFCDADPRLFKPHLETFLPYLKPNALQVRREDLDDTKCILLCLFTGALNAQTVVADASFAATLDVELEQLVYRERPDVMLSAIKALGASARIPGGKGDTQLLGCVRRLFGFLDSIKGRTSMSGAPPAQVSNAMRAVLASAAGCAAMLKPPDALVEASLTHVMLRARDAGHASSRANGVKALGLLFERWPEMVLRPAAAEVFTKSLDADKEPDAFVRSVALDALCELLAVGERRVAEGSAQSELEARTSAAARVMRDQDAAQSLVASMMQQHARAVITLLLDLSPRVRVAACLLVGTMLRLGLINPLQCIEPMVALVSDDRWIVHHTAHSFLVDLDERYPEFIAMRVVQGLLEAYHYGVQVEGKNTPSAIVPELSAAQGEEPHFTVGPLQPTFSVFSRLYRSCLAKNAKQRVRFFNNALALFHFDYSLFDSPADTDVVVSSDPIAVVTAKRQEQPLRVLQYVVETLATLPYTLFDEPLFLVYYINRIISLHGDTIRSKLTPMFDENQQQRKGAGESYNKQRLHRLNKTAQRMMILLQLKEYLKSTYALSDMRCQKFHPNESTLKAAEKPLSNALKALPHFPPADPAILVLFDDGDGTEYISMTEQLAAYKDAFISVMNAFAEDSDDLGNVQDHKDVNELKPKKIRRLTKLQREKQDVEAAAQAAATITSAAEHKGPSQDDTQECTQAEQEYTKAWQQQQQ